LIVFEVRKKLFNRTCASSLPLPVVVSLSKSLTLLWLSSGEHICSYWSYPPLHCQCSQRVKWFTLDSLWHPEGGFKIPPARPNDSCRELAQLLRALGSVGMYTYLHLCIQLRESFCVYMCTPVYSAISFQWGRVLNLPFHQIVEKLRIWFFFFGGRWDWGLSSRLAKQALYCWSHSSSPVYLILLVGGIRVI
jgi:hypothetical protein